MLDSPVKLYCVVNSALNRALFDVAGDRELYKNNSTLLKYAEEEEEDLEAAQKIIEKFFEHRLFRHLFSKVIMGNDYTILSLSEKEPYEMSVLDIEQEIEDIDYMISQLEERRILLQEHSTVKTA